MSEIAVGSFSVIDYALWLVREGLVVDGSFASLSTQTPNGHRVRVVIGMDSSADALEQFVSDTSEDDESTARAVVPEEQFASWEERMAAEPGMVREVREEGTQP